MRTKIFLKWAVALLFAAFMLQSAYADIYIKQKQHTDAMTIMGMTQPAQDLISESWITSDKIVSMNEKQKSIIDMGKKVITIVNHEKKTIVEMPMDISRVMGKTGDMSAEEKVKYQQFMGKMMQMDVKVEETKEKKKIGKWKCRKYLQTITMSMGTTSSEIWATEDIKVDEGLYSKYAIGMLAQMPGMSQNMDAIKQEMRKIKGVHVYSKQTTMMMGQPLKSSIELIEFKEAKAPSKVFDLPAGYKKEGAFR
ncbi:MAG: hypothetical protein U9Q90_11400 [Campylobacterota bacterium]|nr:hypothetical protein [Campylobacterota bacterium]